MLLKEFREFALKGNVIDMAVGIILGVAFGSLVTTLVNEVLMPPIGLLLKGVDFSNIFFVIKEGAGAPYASLAEARADGAVTINIGLFINAVISFFIIGFTVFLMVKSVNRLRRPGSGAEEPALSVRECPYCLSKVPLKALRCPHCTSDISS